MKGSLPKYELKVTGPSQTGKWEWSVTVSGFDPETRRPQEQTVKFSSEKKARRGAKRLRKLAQAANRMSRAAVIAGRAYDAGLEEIVLSMLQDKKIYDEEIMFSTTVEEIVEAYEEEWE